MILARLAWHLRVLVTPILALPLALAAHAQTNPPEAWQSARGTTHPLIGRIWDAGRAQEVDASTLLARLAGARFVLLGEKHDNPDHHRLQAWVLRGLIAAGRRPAVAFEMLEADQQPAIDRHLAAAPGDAAGLAAAVDWARSGWPDWAMYQPIVEFALAAGLPIVAANLSSADLMALRQGGVAALDPGRRVALGLGRSLAAATRDALTAEIRDAHCGHMPERALGRMVEIQRGRDAGMADALIRRGQPDGAVLIAGAGHVRTDRAVPEFLRERAPGVPIASVAYLEVVNGAASPGAYAARFGGWLPFDYVWFTPRVDDEDPCERFRRSLERLRAR